MAFAVPAAEAVVALAHLGLAILEGIQSLDEKRSRFTQDFVTNAGNQYPDYNVVIIHTNHSKSGIYIHQHVELDFFLGTTIGYEIYFSKIGDPFDLVNLGDGGYINWAFNGYFNRDGNHIAAFNPSPPSPPPSPKGSQRYSINGDIVTVNGVSGRLLRESEPLYSFKKNGNSLSKYVNGQSGPYYQATIQTDGNFVVYYFDANHHRTPKFWTNTGGRVNDPNWKLMQQSDGNLVLSHTDLGGNNGASVWASMTGRINKPAPGYFGLSMQQDGNLVLYLFYTDGTCDPVWATSNNAPTGRILWNH